MKVPHDNVNMKLKIKGQAESDSYKEKQYCEWKWVIPRHFQLLHKIDILNQL